MKDFLDIQHIICKCPLAKMESPAFIVVSISPMNDLRCLQSSSRAEPRISEMKGGGRLLDADCIFAYQV